MSKKQETNSNPAEKGNFNDVKNTIDVNQNIRDRTLKHRKLRKLNHLFQVHAKRNSAI